MALGEIIKKWIQVQAITVGQEKEWVNESRSMEIPEGNFSVRWKNKEGRGQQRNFDVGGIDARGGDRGRASEEVNWVKLWSCHKVNLVETNWKSWTGIMGT